MKCCKRKSISQNIKNMFIQNIITKKENQNNLIQQNLKCFRLKIKGEKSYFNSCRGEITGAAELRA